MEPSNYTPPLSQLTLCACILDNSGPHIWVKQFCFEHGSKVCIPAGMMHCPDHSNMCVMDLLCGHRLLSNKATVYDYTVYAFRWCTFQSSSTLWHLHKDKSIYNILYSMQAQPSYENLGPLQGNWLGLTPEHP